MEVFILYTLCVIAFTIVSARYFSSVPYFPIEISRCAASDFFSAGIFKWGLLSAIPVLLFTGSDALKNSYFIWIAVISIQGITFFDDVHYYSIHMGSVAALGCSALGFVLFNFEWWRLKLIMIAFSVWCLRIVVKIGVLVIFEGAKTADDCFKKNQVIMYNGAAWCNPITLDVFKICGVMQWIVFLLLSFIF